MDSVPAALVAECLSKINTAGAVRTLRSVVPGTEKEMYEPIVSACCARWSAGSNRSYSTSFVA